MKTSFLLSLTLGLSLPASTLATKSIDDILGKHLDFCRQLLKVKPETVFTTITSTKKRTVFEYPTTTEVLSSTTTKGRDTLTLSDTTIYSTSTVIPEDSVEVTTVPVTTTKVVTKVESTTTTTTATLVAVPQRKKAKRGQPNPHVCKAPNLRDFTPKQIKEACIRVLKDKPLKTVTKQKHTKTTSTRTILKPTKTVTTEITVTVPRDTKTIQNTFTETTTFTAPLLNTETITVTEPATFSTTIFTTTTATETSTVYENAPPPVCSDFVLGSDCGENFFCCPGLQCNEFLVCDYAQPF